MGREPSRRALLGIRCFHLGAWDASYFSSVAAGFPLRRRNVCKVWGVRLLSPRRECARAVSFAGAMPSEWSISAPSLYRGFGGSAGPFGDLFLPVGREVRSSFTVYLTSCSLVVLSTAMSCETESYSS